MKAKKPHEAVCQRVRAGLSLTPRRSRVRPLPRPKFIKTYLLTRGTHSSSNGAKSVSRIAESVYDGTGQRIGDVESISIDHVSDKIAWIVVRRGPLFARETTIPASLIKTVTDHITLNASTEAVKRLGLRPDTAPYA